jgi:acetolactate synthase small subunit
VAERRWVFVVRALDKPGTLTATAAVFSNRGVSLEGVLASGIAPTTVENGRIILIFRATEEKQALLQRTLERLSIIFQVDVYTYDDERLRAIAVAKLTLDAAIASDDHYSIEDVATTANSRIVMLTGTPPVVDKAVSQFREQGNLKDVVTSYITI